MKIGIDTSNLREGGGRTHLIELLSHGEPSLGRIDRVVVWGAAETIAALPRRSWIDARHEGLLDRALPHRLAWQATRAPRLAREVDLMFAPGGFTSSRIHPRVVMSRNMLPFELEERRRFGHGPMRLRLELLRRAQQRSFVTADGVIFLTTYAQRVVTAALPRAPRRTAVIPHGVSARFRMEPRPQAPATTARPLRVLYVSAVSPYKHQLELVRAVGRLHAEVPVELTLIGPTDGTRYVERVRDAIAEVDPAGRFVRYLGKVGFSEVHRHYHEHDAFAFASSCENMPNILIEAMSSGLPIACARRGPMPDLLDDAGVYFDPDDPADIAAALRRLALDPGQRARLARSAYDRSVGFGWDACARATFSFLAEVATAS